MRELALELSVEGGQGGEKGSLRKGDEQEPTQRCELHGWRRKLRELTDWKVEAETGGCGSQRDEWGQSPRRLWVLG